MDFEQFTQLIGPENHAARLLLIHMFPVDYALAKMCLGPEEKSRVPRRKDTIIGWARSASANVPAKYKEYAVWIDYYCQKLESTDHCRHLFTP